MLFTSCTVSILAHDCLLKNNINQKKQTKKTYQDQPCFKKDFAQNKRNKLH